MAKKLTYILVTDNEFEKLIKNSSMSPVLTFFNGHPSRLTYSTPTILEK